MKYEKKTIIFDVDGTIADVEHRRHLVNGDKGFKPDWNAFRKATEDDTPVQWVCDIAKRFIAQVFLSRSLSNTSDILLISALSCSKVVLMISKL